MTDSYQEFLKQCEEDYQDYLEWSETYEVPDCSQATDFMILMFWWVPFLIIFMVMSFFG